MRIALFCHSLCSDWNHGNAHFLRGVATELLVRGHEVRIFEPRDAWSARNLIEQCGTAALDETRAHYPLLAPVRYDASHFDLERAVDGTDAVLVHEWNEPELIARLGQLRRRGGTFRLLFHDTHHRAASDPEAIRRFDLSAYDGVLAFGESLAERYRAAEMANRVFVWHEAADTRIFHPPPVPEREAGRLRDVVFVGNWGDDERTGELREFLLTPIADLRLSATVYGVRYPDEALAALGRAGAHYGGWIPNYRVPAVFATHRITVHVPRRPYALALPGIPTIRPFEAMACAIPLICAPWDDCEHLFQEGRDYLLARSGAEAKAHIALLLSDRAFADKLAHHALSTILTRHTCAHRVNELFAILDELEPPVQGAKARPAREEAPRP
jgi:spore maturation protein CgeB